MPEYNPTADYDTAFQQAISRMRAGQARQRGALAQATSGVRTSGVRFIPQETLERGFSEAEQGLVGDFAENQANTGIQDRRRREDEAFQLRVMREGGDLQQAIERRRAQNQLRAGLIGGGSSAIASYYTGRGGA